jgi:DNA-binding MarR family transcriptional regulator
MKERRTNRLLPARILSDPKVAQLLLQPTRWKILTELSNAEKCAKDLAESFNTSEQVI